MRKNTIYAEHPYEDSPMFFWLVGENERQYIFSAPFHPVIYQYFKNGRNLDEMRKHVWNRNSRLDQLIERRIPYELKRLGGTGFDRQVRKSGNKQYKDRT